MDVEFAFVCDFGELLGDKLTAHGIAFEAINSQRVPFQHPLFCFVAQLSVPRDQSGYRDLLVRVVHSDGSVLFELPLPGINFRYPYGPRSVAKIAAKLEQVRFPTFGPHEVRLYEATRLLTAVQFLVREPISRPT